MSELTELGGRLHATATALPIAEAEQARQACLAAREKLFKADIRPDGAVSVATAALKGLKAVCDGTLKTADLLGETREQIAVYMTALGLGSMATHEPGNPFNTSASQAETDYHSETASTLSSLLCETANGPDGETRTPKQRVNDILALKDRILKGLLDPTHGANIAASLKTMTEGMNDESLSKEERALKRALREAAAKIAYENKGQVLRTLATQKVSPELAELAKRILFNSYSTFRFTAPPAAITELLSEKDILGSVMADAVGPDGAHPGNIIEQQLSWGETPTPALLAAHTPPQKWEKLADTLAALPNKHMRRLVNISFSKLIHHPLMAANVSAIGLDLLALGHTWADALTEPRDPLGREAFQGECLKTIVFMEAYRPGSPKLLNETFDIENFGQYGSLTLFSLCDAAENPPERYALVAIAKKSHNAAMISVGRRLDKIIENLPDGADMVIPVEVSSLSSAHKLKRRLRKLGWHTPQQLVPAAHGEEDSIQLSFFDNPGQSDKSWSLAALLHGIVAPGGTIDMMSCSTGKKEDGIAQQIADFSGRTVQAPPVVVKCGLGSDVDEATGKVTLLVAYGNDDGEVQPRFFTPKPRA